MTTITAPSGPPARGRGRCTPYPPHAPRTFNTLEDVWNGLWRWVRKLVAVAVPAYEHADTFGAVWLAAVKSWPRLRSHDETVVKCWLRTIIKRAAIRTYERRRRDPARVSFNDEIIAGVQRELRASGEFTEIRRRELARALWSLTPQRRRVIWLIEVIGRTETETARLLGISQGRVSRLRRLALIQLATRLEDLQDIVFTARRFPHAKPAKGSADDQADRASAGLSWRSTISAIDRQYRKQTGMIE